MCVHRVKINGPKSRILLVCVVKRQRCQHQHFDWSETTKKVGFIARVENT